MSAASAKPTAMRINHFEVPVEGSSRMMRVVSTYHINADLTKGLSNLEEASRGVEFFRSRFQEYIQIPLPKEPSVLKERLQYIQSTFSVLEEFDRIFQEHFGSKIASMQALTKDSQEQQLLIKQKYDAFLAEVEQPQGPRIQEVPDDEKL